MAAGGQLMTEQIELNVCRDPHTLRDHYDRLAVGLVALATLAMHGALWITMKTDEGLQARSRRMALRLW